MTDKHFHANMVEDNGVDLTDPTSLGSFETREQAQQALLREAGSIAGLPTFALVKTSLTGSGLDVVEFYNSRTGVTLSLSAWACDCDQGREALRG